jgi:hypothetical protein
MQEVVPQLRGNVGPASCHLLPNDWRNGESGLHVDGGLAWRAWLGVRDLRRSSDCLVKELPLVVEFMSNHLAVGPRQNDPFHGCMAGTSSSHH